MCLIPSSTFARGGGLMTVYGALRSVFDTFLHIAMSFCKWLFVDDSLLGPDGCVCYLPPHCSVLLQGVVV